ncbi:MAG: type 1 periplasmic binding fold superfamily protein [Bacteroidota bacterium]
MTKATFKLLFSVMLIISTVLLTSCDPEGQDGGEEEINQVVLTLSNGTTVTWNDGDATPDITLDANSDITGTVEFFNVEGSDTEDVTEEIKEEDDEHFVCYEITSANLTIAATDSDGTLPIGLATRWTVGDASTGVMILKLRHQPGVKDGSCDPGDSDVELDFNITIQ